MKSTKHCLKKQARGREEEKYNGGDELVQITLYMCMGLS
jgi:hypothetical protein